MASINILPSAGNKVGRPILMGAATAAFAMIVAGAVTAQTAPATPAAISAKPAAVPAVKPPAVAKPLWASLTPAQKTALEPLSGEWDRMEAPRKQKWLEIANRFASMKPDEQARVHEKMREWVKMTPDERRLVRENYTKAKKLDVTQKSAQWEKYQQLPEEQKQKLAAEAASSKKQLTNLPPPAQANLKTVAPIKQHPQPATACPAGSVKNPALANPAAPGAALVPACVAVAATVPTAATPAVIANSPASSPTNAK